MNLSEASGAYLSVRRQEGFSSHTINAYRLQHEILIRDIGDLGVCPTKKRNFYFPFFDS